MVGFLLPRAGIIITRTQVLSYSRHLCGARYGITSCASFELCFGCGLVETVANWSCKRREQEVPHTLDFATSWVYLADCARAGLERS